MKATGADAAMIHAAATRQTVTVDGEHLAVLTCWKPQGGKCRVFYPTGRSATISKDRVRLLFAGPVAPDVAA